MLFNSFVFLFYYLPIVVIVFFWLGRYNSNLSAAWLGLSSLVFYGYWDYHYIPLLLCSIGFNFWTGYKISSAEIKQRKIWLIFAITSNLLLLAYFKYTDFFIYTINVVSNADFETLNIVLPIGISFYTFTQIAFLVDTYEGKVKEYHFVHYLLFVTYFPHLIAGPVLHHKEMMPQFANSKIYRFSKSDFSIGMTIFCIGLAKKVLIADNLAPYANTLFNGTDTPTLFIAWGGVLAYTFQLYFDFSAYSDMAIGLSRMFGVKLPLNFNSPYKSGNISEFWRRWHMTLSRFLRDYLYIPLGGNRVSSLKRYRNLMVVMLLGGLWHGAGWNFVIWGGLHGIYLIIHHGWVEFAKKIRFPVTSIAWKIIATMLTFMAVCFAWVFFRASDLSTALEIIHGMFGVFGVQLPDAIGTRLGIFAPFLQELGITYFLGGGRVFIETWVWITFAALIAFFLPNTQEILRNFRPALDLKYTEESADKIPGYLIWKPSKLWAISIGVITVLSLLSLNRPNDFLYFQF